MILCIRYDVPAVAQEKADKVNLVSSADLLLSKVDQHLLAGRCVEYILIDPGILWLSFDNAVFLQIMHIVTQCLLIARQLRIFTILDKFLLENIVDGAYT